MAIGLKLHVMKRTRCVEQDQLLLKQTPATFRGVLGAKVCGLLAMAPHLQAAPVAAVALFSSVSSIVAPLGQPNYAAANAMLNAWANTQTTQVCIQQFFILSIPPHAAPHAMNTTAFTDKIVVSPFSVAITRALL